MVTSAVTLWRRPAIALLILMVPGVNLLLATIGRAEPLRAGAATVKITPPVGTPLAGYYHERQATGIHDDLFAKSLVLQQGNTTAVMVSLDLISTTREVVQKARRRIAEMTGIPAEHVMISATHSHTGPIFAQTSRRYDSQGGRNARAIHFTEELPERIAESVARASEALQPVTVSATVGHEESIAFNRRFHMTDGTVGWNPGKLNPMIVKAAGPIDPQVPVVFFHNAEDGGVATYVNYAVHLDNVGGQQISADLPHTVARCLAQFQGDQMVTVYTSGTCGDINHIDVSWEQPQKGHENAARMGIILAGEVLRCWPQLEPVAEQPLVVRRQIVHLPLAPVTDQEISAARDTVRELIDQPSSPPKFLDLVQAFKVLDVADRAGKSWDAEVQVITLGDQLAWVALPGEIFVELGLAIKQDSPFPQTMITTLANGSLGYIPSLRAYSQGNYEVISARCAEGSGELLVAAAVQMLTDIYVNTVNH